MWPFDRLRKKAAENAHGGDLRTGGSIWTPRGDYSLSGSEAVFGAVTMLASTVASARLKLYRGADEVKDHPLHKLLCYRPSPRMTPYTFWQSMEACRDTAGNCYALKVPSADGRSIDALDVLVPSCVSVLTDKKTGDLWYEMRPKEGNTLYVPAWYMLHCRHVTAGGDVGVNPVNVLSETLRYDDQMKTFSLEQVRGVSGAVVLEIPSSLGQEQKKSVIDNFMENYRRSNSSLLVLTGGTKASSINKSVVDSKVLDVDRITANKVARVYNLPPALMGDYSTSSFNSQEQQQLQYIQRTIFPILRMYEDELNSKLLTYEEIREGFHFTFDVNDLSMADAQTRANVHQMYVRGGVMRPNEARARENLPADPNGNTLLASKDLQPLSMIVRGGTENGVLPLRKNGE